MPWRLHDRLVGRAVLGAVGAVWLVILAIDLVFALMDNLGSIGQGDYGAGTALLALLLTLPRRLYDLFPYAAVIGSLMGLGALAASRSDERRVGTECVSTCSSRWLRYH